MLDKRIKFDERYDSEEENITTLYFTAPKEYLKMMVDTDYPDAVSMEISIEFPTEHINANYASVSISPTNKYGEDYDWNDIYLPYDEIQELIKLAGTTE